jgi:endonuclease/exonuclease/phosphatase (EEP) superfamily protein YafD
VKRPIELLLLLAIGCAHATRTPRPAAADEPVLTVLTYNLNYGIAGDEATIAAILERDADLVFLQETNARWRAALEPRLAGRYPGRVWLDGPAASGLAVLSRQPLTAQKLDNPTGWFPALRVVTGTPLGPVQTLCVHLHPPVSEDGSWVKGYLSTGGVRRAEIDHFLAALDPKLPTLVAGDFNEGPSGEALQRLEALGLRTALSEFQPRAKTWHWPVGRLKLTAQLDHVAYSRAFEPLDAHVERDGSSDHWPVTVTLVRAKRGAGRPAAPSGTSLSID